jgi:RNA-binding protein
MSKENLRKLSHSTEVTIWIGKGGIENIIAEMDQQLKERRVVKVKFLPASKSEKSVKELAVDLANKIRHKEYETIGNVAIFMR